MTYRQTVDIIPQAFASISSACTQPCDVTFRIMPFFTIIFLFCTYNIFLQTLHRFSNDIILQMSKAFE